MDASVVQKIKSQPVYSPVKRDTKGHYNVFVTEDCAFSTLRALFDSFPPVEKKLLIVSDINVGGFIPQSQRIASAEMQSMFERYLADLPLDTRIYIAGSEAFLWDVHALAIKAGLASEQISMFEPATKVRRVFCGHCYTLISDVLYSPVVCPSCQRLLEVRDHFSKQHAAYLGVQCNAEDSAAIPMQKAFE